MVMGAVLLMIVGALALAPQRLWTALYGNTVAPLQGTLSVPGLRAAVSVRRDALGIPVVEASNLHDLAFAAGWVMATDRIEQMVSFSLLAQGRLSEMVGAITLPMDRHMRLLALDQAARLQLEQQDAQMQTLLEDFANGVNAWLAAHADRLPMGLQLAGYTPEPWTPLDSMRVYAMLTQGLGVNLQEELAFMTIAARVGPDKAAWLFPVYPDEPLPLDEAARLAELDWSAAADPALLGSLMPAASRLFPGGQAASNNWAVAPARMQGCNSLIANDTHLLLSQPPLWMLMQLRSPEYTAGGIAMAGIPGIVAGSNGRVGWGITMVMADTQDVFVEQLRAGEEGPEYLTEDGWRAATPRSEVFHIKGEAAHEETFWQTRHGPLLNPVLTPAPLNKLQPPAQPMPWGLAVRHNLHEPDQSLRALFSLGQARDLAEAQAYIRAIRFIPLNMLYGDAQQIGWQVTGRYPVRPQASGKLPVPGWTGEHAWAGWLPVDAHPHVENPPEGFLATANHRTVPTEQAALSRSWYYPERYERIVQVLGSDTAHSAAATQALHFDQVNVLVPKVQGMFRAPDVASALDAALSQLAVAEQASARRVLTALLDFDGDMRADSTSAARFGMFEHQFVREVFLDELGPDDSPAWKALMAVSGMAYAAGQDHLLGRHNSPFWDDSRTEVRETKAMILARALARVEPALRESLGEDPAGWQWGRLHTYEWQSSASEFAPHLPAWQRPLARWLGAFMDRGPYPAGGDRNTVNVAGHTTGQDFAVWNIPAMRMIVDFNAEEPLQIINSGGQSGNPLSPHYDDGIAVWLQPGNRSMPLDAQRVSTQYAQALRLQPLP